MVEAGARAFLSKAITAEMLAEAMRRVSKGERLLYEGGALAPLPLSLGPVVPGGAGEIEPLGKQQRRVLALLTKGYSNTQIGEYLGISATTARYHVSAILAKLGVTNRAEAAALATRLGLFDNSDF